MASSPSSSSPSSSSSSAPPRPAPPSSRANHPTATGYDPQTSWWLNYFSLLAGRMTPLGQFHFREDTYAANEARDCSRCETWRDQLFAQSPVIIFLSQRLRELNGRVDASNVYCRRCPARVDEDGTVMRQAGGFDPRHGILICANEMRDRKHLEVTLAHEMVHAWDVLRWKADFSGGRDLRHAACTEIRASMLSGECKWSREAGRGNYGIVQQFQNCVRQRAIASLLHRPSCRDTEHATKLVNQVWDSCFSDTRPFDEIYR